MTPVQLRCEYLSNPAGVDSTAPRLSWMLDVRGSTKRGQRQTAYQILVASSEVLLDQDSGDLWDSGRVDSDQSIQVEYAGRPLTSLLLCHWKARVWNEDGQVSVWSAPATWRMALLEPKDWLAQWILCPARGKEGGGAEGLCPWFRKSFELETVPDSAVACVSSIGYHELYVNGHKVGDQVLVPSVSDLRKRALYLTHDITPYLTTGRNVVAIWLAPGWSMFSDANPPVDFNIKSKPLCLAQIDLGPAFPPLVTDDTWLCAPSNTTHLGKWQNSDFGGDRVDATIDTADWNEPGFDDSAWQNAEVARQQNWVLSPDLIEPNRLGEKIEATKMSRVAEGKYRFIMARLFAGWIEVKIKGRPGTTVTMKVSTLADRELECNQRNEYVIGASGEGTFRNRFSYHEVGFVTVEGLDQEPQLSDVVGYRVTNDRRRIGDFDCSNRLLKQIYDITVDTYVNLCTGGMTVDCPHRERLGYGGDGHTSMELALDAFDSAAFLTKWAQDWCDIQDEDGRINHTAPTIGGGGGPAWSGFILTMPWEVYQSLGDRRILERTYPFSRKWLTYLARHVGSDHLLQPLPSGPWAYMDDAMWLFLGDWVAPGRHEWSATPEALLFNNCYYLHVLRLAAQIARLLGHSEDEELFLKQSGDLKEAINRRFLVPSAKVYLDTKQTHNVMPLVSGAVPEHLIAAVEQNLEDEILVACQGHLDTGMHGTYFMTKYLTQRHRNDLVFTYATQLTYPSYGKLIADGFSTWPEHWEGGDSRLHGCLNGIGGWFQRGLAGITTDPSAPGYKKIIIRPALIGGLTWLNAYHESPYGRIVSNWKRENGLFSLNVIIPPNTSAMIYLPCDKIDHLQESGHPLAAVEATKIIEKLGGCIVLEVGSGTYNFTVNISNQKVE